MHGQADIKLHPAGGVGLRQLLAGLQSHQHSNQAGSSHQDGEGRQVQRDAQAGRRNNQLNKYTKFPKTLPQHYSLLRHAKDRQQFLFRLLVLQRGDARESFEKSYRPGLETKFDLFQATN